MAYRKGALRALQRRQRTSSHMHGLLSSTENGKLSFLRQGQGLRAPVQPTTKQAGKKAELVLSFCPVVRARTQRVRDLGSRPNMHREDSSCTSHYTRLWAKTVRTPHSSCWSLEHTTHGTRAASCDVVMGVELSQDADGLSLWARALTSRVRVKGENPPSSEQTRS